MAIGFGDNGYSTGAISKKSQFAKGLGIGQGIDFFDVVFVA